MKLACCRWEERIVEGQYVTTTDARSIRRRQRLYKEWKSWQKMNIKDI